MPYRLLRDQWFLIGICIVTLIGLVDPFGTTSHFGEKLQRIQATQWGIFFIFIFSGIELRWGHLLDSLKDWRATGLALAFIFLVAPAIAFLLTKTTSSPDLQLGLLIIGVVPTSLASGMVMTGASGGRMEHALVITIFANVLCIATIPLELSFLLSSNEIRVPIFQMSFNLLILVAIPLFIGIGIRWIGQRWINSLPFKPNLISRCIVLLMVFIGIYQGRKSILGHTDEVILAFVFSLFLHLALCVAIWTTIKALQWKSPRYESVFFMSIQKTLPLALWLQTTFFPKFGIALSVCVFYHVIQLMIDSYFVNRFSSSNRKRELSS
jgi:solute carrier family 10 (sodium/bile acid cotransporter), member 7